MIKKYGFVLIIFIIALIPRVYGLDQTELYPDEITWMVRGKETIYAIKQLNLKYFDTAWWHIQDDTQAISIPLVLINGPFLILFGKNQSAFSLGLFSDIESARLPIAILNSFFIVIFYFFLRKIFSSGLSLFTSILLALDPIMIGFGRLVMNDTLLTFFTFIAICGFLFLDKSKSVLIAGSSLALGFLTKPNGLLPIISWLIYVFWPLKYKKSLLIKLILSLVISFFFIIILWPSSWHSPLFSVFEYVFRQTIIIENQPLRRFFMGEVTYNPPRYFYLFQIAARLPSLLLIGLVLSPIFIVLKLKTNKTWKQNINLAKFVAITVYCLVFLLIISFVPEKVSVRYILPLWPWIYIISCWTIFEIANLFKNKTICLIFISLFVVYSLFLVIQYNPSYQLFYNRLVGGPGNAQKYNLVGLCSGVKGALKFIDQNYNLNEPVAIMGCSKVVAPYYSSRKITTDWQNSNLVIIEYAFEQLMPQSEVIKYFKNKIPIYVVKEKGATLSKIYTKN